MISLTMKHVEHPFLKNDNKRNPLGSKSGRPVINGWRAGRGEERTSKTEKSQHEEKRRRDFAWAQQ
jgi:hypothetical protein